MRVCVIRLLGFPATAGARVRAIAERASRRHEPVILDLRGNPGGLLSQAVAVVRVFARSGVVVTTQGLHEPPRQFVADDTAVGRLRLAVLINGGTASAAEVVAGALHADAGRGRRRAAELRQGHGAGGRAARRRRRAQADGGQVHAARRARRRGPRDPPDDPGRRPARPGPTACSRAALRALRGVDATPPAPAPVVCQVSLRARVTVGEPFFEHGRALTLGRVGSVDARPGDLVAVRITGPGQGVVVAASRTARATCPPSCTGSRSRRARPRRGRPRWPPRSAGCPPSRRTTWRGRADLRSRPDVHDRPRGCSRPRRRPVGGRRPRARPHRRCGGVRARGRRDRGRGRPPGDVGVPARAGSTRCCPSGSRPTSAASLPGRDRWAVTVEVGGAGAAARRSAA